MLKTYKNTILLSAAVSAVCVLITVIFECIDGLPKYCVAIENYAIGIACSLLVVIITTYINFKAEQTKTVNEIGSNILNIVEIVHYCKTVSGSENESSYGKEVFKIRFAEYYSTLKNQCWLFGKHKPKLDDLNQLLVPMAYVFGNERFTHEMRPIDQIATGNELIEILNKSEVFCDKDTKLKNEMLKNEITRCMENKELNYN